MINSILAKQYCSLQNTAVYFGEYFVWLSNKVNVETTGPKVFYLPRILKKFLCTKLENGTHAHACVHTHKQNM